MQLFSERTTRAFYITLILDLKLIVALSELNYTIQSTEKSKTIQKLNKRPLLVEYSAILAPP